jgi:hypothetical protein
MILTLLVFSALAQAPAQELIIPVVANGYVKPPLHYQTVVRVLNAAGEAVEITVEGFQNDGTATRLFELFPLPRPGTKSVFKIEPFGSLELSTAGDEPAFHGWIRLTFPASAQIQASAEVALIDAPVGPHPICSRTSKEIINTVEVRGVAAAARSGGFAVIRPNRQSAYAILNPTEQTAEVFLSLLNFSGTLAGSATLKIPAHARVSKFLGEMLTAAASDFMGSLRVSSVTPVGAAAINVIFPDGKLAAVTVNPEPAKACVTVIQPARNPLTGECRLFPTPCDVPAGWVKVSSCN